MNNFLTLRRLYFHGRCRRQSVRNWLAEPLAAKRLDARSARYLVVDLEMTGLNWQRDSIISVGWVAVNNGAISLASAEHLYIKRSDSVGQSATIHQIRDTDLQQGLTEREALQRLLEASRGRVVVFHAAQLDYRFLSKAWRSAFDVPFLAPVVDTLLLERRRLQRADRPIKSGDLRLAACRQRYNLPFYPAHNALIDALAAAELLLAILANKGKCSLGSILD